METFREKPWANYEHDNATKSRRYPLSTNVNSKSKNFGCSIWETNEDVSVFEIFEVLSPESGNFFVGEKKFPNLLLPKNDQNQQTSKGDHVQQDLIDKLSANMIKCWM